MTTFTLHDLTAVQYQIGHLTGGRCDLQDVRDGIGDLYYGLSGVDALIKDHPEVVAQQLLDYWGVVPGEAGIAYFENR